MKSFQATRIFSLFGDRLIYRVGQNGPSRYLGTSYGSMFKKLPQTFAKHQTGGLLHLLRPTVSAIMYPILHLYRSGSVSTTRTQGPVAEKKMPSKKQIAGTRHVITLQEAAEYVDHDLLTSRFHVTHYAGSAILFNKDTFYSNIDVKSIYLHDTRSSHGWRTGVGHARCSFTCLISSTTNQRPGNLYCVVSTYQQHLRQEERHRLTIRAIMISQQIDVVPGDFKGTAWRCRSRNNIITIDEACTDCALPTPPGPTPLW